MQNRTCVGVAREIIKSYLNENEDTREIASLLNEEANGEYENLKIYIKAIINVMNKALKEIEKLESKNEN